MVWFELKKVLGRPGGKIALFLFACVVALACWLSANDGSRGMLWVNGQGKGEVGFSAARKLHAAQDAWEGYLDEEHLADIIRELNRIAATPEYRSEDTHQKDIAFGWMHSVLPVRTMLSKNFVAKYDDFNWYLGESLSPSAASRFYTSRMDLLEAYLYDETRDAYDRYTQQEKQYLISQYRKLEGPIYYDYKEGWHNAVENASYITLLGCLILGFLVSGIFANEYKWKSDAVLFSTYYGRDKAVAAKIKAGVLLVTVLYWAGALIFTLFTLCYLGFDGGSCAIQFDYWRSIYNLTYWQTHLLSTVNSYIAIVFISFLCMWISAKTKSSVFAVTVPFILIFGPNFLENSEFGEALGQVLGLMPDKLMNIHHHIVYLDNVYDLGFTVMGAMPLLLVLYTLLTLVLVPVTYQAFRTG